MDTKTLKTKSISSVFWKLSERLAAKLVSLVVSIILARLLTPSDYSVVGIVSIFFVFANVFISGGFNTALIQKKEVGVNDYCSVLYISMSIATLMYIILFFSAPKISSLYNQEILTPVIRIMGITLFINAFKSILCAYTSRELNFKSFFMATIVGTIISAVIGIGMAYYGFGPWALVAQQMSNSFIDTLILFFTTKFKFVYKFAFQNIKQLFNFGWKIFVSNIISVIYDEINPLVIGLKFNAVDLSFYTKGRTFPHLINTTLGDTFSAVLFPAMSKIQDNKAIMLQYTRRFLKLSSFLVFPAMIGFCAIADTFVLTVLTSKWLPSVFYIRVFCFVFMLNIIQKGNLEVIKACGRSDLILKMEIAKKTCYFIVIVLFLIFTNTPKLLAVACLVNTLIATCINTFPNRKIIGYSYRLQIADLLPNLITAAIMGVCVWLVGFISINKILLLFLQIMVGVLVYIILNLIIKNQNLYFGFNLLKNFIKRGDAK